VNAIIAMRGWNAARAAVLDSAEQFSELFSSCDHRAMATPDWTVADTAAHVTAIALWDTALVQPGQAPAPYPWDTVSERLRVTTVDTVFELNGEVMRRFAERDPQVLAQQLRDHVSAMLATSADLDPDLPVPWLGGSRIPLAAVFAHLTNELQIHGRDIARAVGRRWVTPPSYAAQFFEIFVAGVTRHGTGRLLYREDADATKVTVQFTTRYGEPVTLALDHGVVALSEGDAQVDVRISADPVMLNLMLFGRVSRLRAVLTGQVRVSGRRPWLLPAFLRTVRFPS
jgi:uncharacterized protein (TIGR03083 family)